MKKIVAVLAVLLVAGVGVSTAQVLPGKFELGTSICYYNLKFDDAESEALNYLSIPIRFGWTFWQGLEIEPEVQLFVPMGDTGGDTAYFLQGKLLYNFSLGGNVVPFIGGGAGIGNGIPVFGIVEGGSDIKTFAFTGLVGLKLRIGNSAALRIEYRFNRFSWEDEFSIDKDWGNWHNVLVGVSIFL
ncbi:MAG TPA: hypothetical protein ENO03_02655 [Candidatus Aminicenantes bacterium]|nr:hypothetical protein [Candidatus Aminicenantes bacterium]